MKNQSALKRMSKDNQYLVHSFYVAYFAMGVYLLLIGSVLPMIKAEYALSYGVGGMMMSFQSIGYLITGAFVGVLLRFFSVKRLYLVLSNLAFIGLALMMVTGNPVVLLTAMLMTGISKGITCNFGNQIVSSLSGNDASLLNLIQAFFAIGACAAPLISMMCGASWRTAFAITIAIGVCCLIYSARIHIDSDAYAQTPGGKLDFGFFRTKVFWLCALILLCYLAFEASIMGWMVTFIVDSGAATETIAQLMATALWAALLVGRFASAWFAQRFQPHQMIVVMTAGMTVCFTCFMLSRSLLPMAISAMGLGLFMAGMYGTAIAGSGGLVERYPLCMGMFIAIPGIGSAVTPSAIGMVSDQIGIRGGMSVLYVILALLIVVTVLFVRYQKTHRQSDDMENVG